MLRRVIPFDAACWHTLDPATLLETSHLVENLPLENPRAAEIEYLYEDYNQFATLARSRQRSGILSQATGGAPERSRRYRELIRPLGLHGELRGAFVAGRVGWGAVGLLREPGAADFSSRDAAFLHDVSAYLAHGIRTALLLQTAAGGTQGEDVPGLVLFDARQRLEAITPAAEGLLAELADDCLIYGRDGFELRVFLDLRRRKVRDKTVRPKLLKALADKLNAPPGQKSIPF